MKLKLKYSLNYDVPDEEILKKLCDPPLQIGSFTYNKIERAKNETYVFRAKKEFSIEKNSGVPRIIIQLKEGKCEVAFLPEKAVIVFFYIVLCFALLMEFGLSCLIMRGELNIADWWFLLLPIGIVLFAGVLCYTAFYISSIIILKEIRRRTSNASNQGTDDL